MQTIGEAYMLLSELLAASGVDLGFFFEVYVDHRDLHLLSRRQRQMCIMTAYGRQPQAEGAQIPE